MKKKKQFELSFWVLAVIIIALVIMIIIANALLHDSTDWKEILTDLLNDILSVAIVGVVATIFTKVITDNFFKIKKNNDKLLSFGIENIGEGRSNAADILNLFGNKKTNNYPAEIKLMFISGNGFFKTFFDDIKECLQNSDCKIKILLVSTQEDNKEYIERCERLCPQSTSYISQVNDETIIYLQPLMDQFPNRVEIRYYKDEYRYNFRIAKYRLKDGSFNCLCWWNVQPFNKDSVDLSVGLQGSWNSSDKNLSENIFNHLDNGFDLIWDNYR